MRVALRKGLSYGTTSGVITSLGLLIGLYSTSASREVILAGILTIAFADALSDGLGIHISEESENHHSNRSIWESTLATVFSKMVLGLTFVIPLILLSLKTAIIVNVIWGTLALSLLCYKIAKQNKEKASTVLAGHLGIALFVVVGSCLIGGVVNTLIK